MATPAAAPATRTPGRGITVKDVSAADFITAYSKYLKRSGKVEVPRWADIIKTGVHKELAPYDPDWFYVRAASVARKIYLRGGIGIGTFKRIYGGTYNRGSRPSRFQTASGSVVRHVLKQLESLKVIEISKGRKKNHQNWTKRSGSNCWPGSIQKGLDRNKLSR